MVKSNIHPSWLMEQKKHSGITKKKEGETNAATTAKGEVGAYQVSYYQVAAVAPNQYQQQTYAIHIGPHPIQHLQSMQHQQPYTPQRQNYCEKGQQRPRNLKRKFDLILIPHV